MNKSIKLFPALTFGLFGFLFAHLAKSMLQIRGDGYYVGQVNQYGDLVFHLGLINKFLETGKVLIESPIYAGSKPNYPIFADFVTAQIAKLTSIDWALFTTTFLGGLLVIYVARLFIKNFIKSEKVVFLALLLFFVNGGFGFVYFFQDYVNSSQNFFTFLFNIPNEYTDIKEKGYWWINNYLAYFLPQRGFLFAFPLTLTTFLLLYRGVKKNKSLYFLLAGAISGVLPIIQAHSLFVLFLLSIFYFPQSVYRSKIYKSMVKNWLIFALTSAVIAIPLVSTISSSTNALSYVRFEPGFTSEENIIWFWLKNMGLFGPILIIAIIWIFKKNKDLFHLYLPFLFLFFASNILVFQPWAFDNSKILIYFYFASCILVAYFVYQEFFTVNFAKKIVGTLLVFFMILAGSIDLFRTYTKVTNYQIFSSTDVEVATAVKNLTPKEAVFVTASNHNHPIPALSGRSTLLGFHGWIWSHGLPYQQRAQDIEKIYAGGEEASNLIAKYKINYVAIGPQELSEFNINQNYFLQIPQIYLSDNWRLYDVGHLWSNSNW